MENKSKEKNTVGQDSTSFDRPESKIRFIKRIPSRERCAESGWYAWDYLLSAPMDKDFILRFKELGGSFVFLSMLKNPFFKLESDLFALKGVLGDDFFRVSTHEDNEAFLKKIEDFVNGADGHDHIAGQDEA